jgi:uncharacterized lipoprotein
LSLELTVSDQAGNRGVTKIRIKPASAHRAESAPGKDQATVAKPALQEQLRQHGASSFDQQVAQWLETAAQNV